MKIKEFEIEESKVNKGIFILVAIAESGEKFVISGDANYSTKVVPYDKCWDAMGEEKFKDIYGLK